MNRFRRGFSDPRFERGHKSEHDIAVEAMANALERHLLPYEGKLATVNWTGAAMIALAAAESAVVAEAAAAAIQRLGSGRGEPGRVSPATEEKTDG